jgi:hypothetical protein
MKTPRQQAEHIKRLEWFICFCQADLMAFSEGDWLNTLDSMYDFVDFRDPHSPLDKSFYGYAMPDNLLDFQPRVLKVLRKLAVDPKQPKVDEQYGPVIEAIVTCGAYGADQPFEHITDASMELTVIGYLALYRHLVSSEIVRGQLRICPQCDRVFLSRRRPRADITLHCSLKCSRLAATHRYRVKQKQKLKVKERERGHERYVAKQRRRWGAKTKVERRPRIKHRS